MPEIEPRVDEEKLRLLLTEAHESAQLDYKASCNPRERRELVAIAKDVGAMAALGGYIVVGADDAGHPSGEVLAEQLAVFDQADLQGKLRRYLPESVEIRTAAHELDGKRLVVIYVAAHPDGFVVFEADGAYTHTDGRDRFEFRAGEVFVRHGTASERWTQADIARIRQGLRDRERERWRAGFREDIADTLGSATAAQQISQAPAAVLDWHLDEQTLVGALIEQLRREDLLPLELLLMRLPGEARAAAETDDRETLGVVCDRLAAITATVLLARRPELFDAALKALVAIYNAGFDRRGYPRGTGTPPELVWLAVIERVLAIGAFAVRRSDWDAVATLALAKGSGEPFTAGHYRTWVRHALTMAFRAELIGDRAGRPAESASLLNLALQHANRLPALRPDLPEGDEELLSSLCQFDMDVCLATFAHGGDYRDAYPNFARFWSQRSDPAVVTLLTDPAARNAIFPGPDADLAAALHALGRKRRRTGLSVQRLDRLRRPPHPPVPRPAPGPRLDEALRAQVIPALPALECVDGHLGAQKRPQHRLPTLTESSARPLRHAPIAQVSGPPADAPSGPLSRCPDASSRCARERRK